MGDGPEAKEAQVCNYLDEYQIKYCGNCWESLQEDGTHQSDQS